jgi:DNA sulfur modification protein DndB
MAKHITFVPVLEESPRTYLNERTEEGYQRFASRTRMNLFRQFLRNHPTSVVPPVLLSDRGKWKFESSDSEGKLGRLVIEDAAAIIDGQHRVGGYVALYEEDEDDRPIDFILLAGLPLDEERNEFVTVNGTQKGVAKSLVEYLEGTEDGIVAWELNEREDSPLRGRITRQTMQRGHLFQLHSVAKNVGRTFSHGALADLTIDEKVEIAIQYWTTIADHHPEEWADIEKERRTQFEFKLLELTGFIAWSLAAEDLLGPAWSPDMRVMNWNMVDTKIRRVAEMACIDWRKDGMFTGLTGEVGGSRIHREIQRCLQQAYGVPEEAEDQAEDE